MAVYEIPLTPDPQTFSISLAGVTYNLTLQWNVLASAWILDIMSSANVPILMGIAVVANVDLLSPYPYLNFGGKLVAQTDNDPSLVPTFDNLGITSHLYFITS